MNAIQPALNIVVAHENSLTGIRAVAFLNQLSARLEDHLNLGESPWHMDNNNFWNFECLQDMDLREQALTASVDADIILIAAGSQPYLPAWVRTWIESALGKKQGRPSAMVAMFCARQEPPATSLYPIGYLRQLAEQHGVDFFCNLDRRPQPGDADSKAVFNPRFESDSELLQDASVGDFEMRRWGINE